MEIEADVMLKGTRVDGIYTADPEKDPTATKFTDITYQEVLARNLKVMDLSAVVMCNDNHLPIYVFNMDVVGNLKKVMEGDFSFIRGEVTAMQSMPKMEVTLSEASDLRNGKKLDFSAFKDRMGNIDDSEQRVLAGCGDQMIAVVYREVSDGGVLLREERVFA